LFKIQNGIIDNSEKYDLTMYKIVVGLDKDQMKEFRTKIEVIIKARYDSLS